MTTPTKAEGFFVVQNDKGLHTRPSTELVKCASQFQAQIFLKYQAANVNAKSLLGILMLAAPKGSKIKIEAVGVDAQAAVKALVDLASSQFYLKY